MSSQRPQNRRRQSFQPPDGGTKMAPRQARRHPLAAATAAAATAAATATAATAAAAAPAVPSALASAEAVPTGGGNRDTATSHVAPGSGYSPRHPEQPTTPVGQAASHSNSEPQPCDPLPPADWPAPRLHFPVRAHFCRQSRASRPGLCVVSYPRRGSPRGAIHASLEAVVHACRCVAVLVLGSCPSMTASRRLMSLGAARARHALTCSALAPCSAVASRCFRGDFKGRPRAREVFAAVFTEVSSSRAGGHPSPDAAARGKRLPAVSKHVTDQGRRPIDTCGRVGGQGQEAGSVRPARARGQEGGPAPGKGSRHGAARTRRQPLHEVHDFRAEAPANLKRKDHQPAARVSAKELRLCGLLGPSGLAQGCALGSVLVAPRVTCRGQGRHQRGIHSKLHATPQG